MMKSLCCSIFIIVLSCAVSCAQTSTSIKEKLPEFPGGEKALYSYLGEHIKYPKSAVDSGIDGRVYISFVVCKDGSLCEVKPINDIGGGCAAEAVRVVKEMPKWEPALMNGKPVRVSYKLPVRFSMTEKQKRRALRKLKLKKR